MGWGTPADGLGRCNNKAGQLPLSAERGPSGAFKSETCLFGGDEGSASPFQVVGHSSRFALPSPREATPMEHAAFGSP
jgi:hypothetical protein